MQHDNEGGFPMNNNFNESNTDFILINPNDENRDDHKKNRPPRQKRPKEHAFRKRTIATVLSCALIGGASGFGGAMIAERTGASTATISRVNRCLTYGAGGYQLILGKTKFGDEISEGNP